MKYLIVGLGNPGKEYEKTRHNIGFSILDAFALSHNMSFKRKFLLKGHVAIGKSLDHELVLLKPTTYMNLSGIAVKKCLQHYKVEKAQLLIVVDDFDLPLGQLRLKPQGSSGGHNGLKSIEEALQTQDFARLRVGIGRPDKENRDYVLEKFSHSEQTSVSQMEEKAQKAIQLWLEKGSQKAMQEINSKTEDEKE
jgi:PTH1 family peptidyl-tRNA hydrolase